MKTSNGQSVPQPPFLSVRYCFDWDRNVMYFLLSYQMLSVCAPAEFVCDDAVIEVKAKSFGEVPSTYKFVSL